MKNKPHHSLRSDSGVKYKIEFTDNEHYYQLVSNGDNDLFAQRFNQISGDHWVAGGRALPAENIFFSILAELYNQRSVKPKAESDATVSN